MATDSASPDNSGGALTSGKSHEAENSAVERSRMSEDPLSPTLLMECSNTVEASAVRSLLEQNDIAVTIQSENVNAFMPHLQGVMAPRLLVLTRDLEKARAVLSAIPVTQTEGAGLDGGICAVHEKPAVAVCARCGSFLCASCESLGEPPVCESCLEAEKLPPRNTSPARPQLFLLVGVVAVAVAIAVALNMFGRI